MKVFDRIRVTMAKATLVAIMGAAMPVVVPVGAVQDLAYGGVEGLKHDCKKAGKILKSAMRAKTMKEFENATKANH